MATGNVRRLLLTLRGDLSWTDSTLGLAIEPTFVYGEQGDAVRERDVHARGFRSNDVRLTFGIAISSRTAP